MRRRLSVVSAGAVALAVTLACVTAYLVVRGQLRGQVDDSLSAQAHFARTAAVGQAVPPLSRPPRSVPGIGRPRLPTPRSARGQLAGYAQLIERDGRTVAFVGRARLPLVSGIKAVAAGSRPSYRGDVHVGGVHIRVLAQPVADDRTLVLGRAVNDVDSLLSSLRLILAGVLVGGIGLAALLGRLASGRIIRPITTLTETATHIEATHDLERRIDIEGSDEVGQLATQFNAMLDALAVSRGALDDSVRAQRRLVADASHELRTPITSLRVNLELLLGRPDLPRDERSAILEETLEQSRELSGLVADLIELARGAELPVDPEDVRLDLLVEHLVARAGQRAPGADYVTPLAPCTIHAVPQQLERAVNNLLDNAAKYGGASGVVEVSVADGAVEVRDHGPGFAAADLPHVFDRFYRGADSRGRPGSGLGLAIVKQVAESHGGGVTAGNAPEGGAWLRLTLPAVDTVAVVPQQPAGRRARAAAA